MKKYNVTMRQKGVYKKTQVVLDEDTAKKLKGNKDWYEIKVPWTHVLLG